MHNNPWPYYYQLEDEVILISRYVSFINENIKTTGNKIAEVILSLSTEFETSIKELNIEFEINLPGQLEKTRLKYPAIDNVRTRFFNSNIELSPFACIAPKQTPEWWGCFTAIKHNRFKGSGGAHIGTMLSAIASLYIINLLRSSESKSLHFCLDTKLIEFHQPWIWNNDSFYRERILDEPKKHLILSPTFWI